MNTEQLRILAILISLSLGACGGGGGQRTPNVGSGVWAVSYWERRLVS
jgi:hypothetical protein